MLEQLDKLEQEARATLQTADDEAALTAWQRAHLGRKGTVTEAVKAIGSLPSDQRPAYGRRVNEVKRTLESAYEEQIEVLKEMKRDQAAMADQVDVTLPGRPPRPGQRLPLVSLS